MDIPVTLTVSISHEALIELRNNAGLGSALDVPDYIRAKISVDVEELSWLKAIGAAVNLGH